MLIQTKEKSIKTRNKIWARLTSLSEILCDFCVNVFESFKPVFDMRSNFLSSNQDTKII